MPVLGWKKDAIPGFINDAWARIDKPGIYHGQCTELCGTGHAFMPIVVKALPENEFERWLANEKAKQAAAAAGGGDPVMYQHIFWFFGHPEVYIMILPAFGIISQVIPAFSRKPLFGYRSMVYATGTIALLSFVVWAHHMFTVGMPLAAEIYFMYATMLIAVPTGVKVFNWVATMWRGALTFETPMLWAFAFVVLFTIGGFSGLMVAIVPADFQYQDTYFVVAHFHYVLVTGAVFAIMAAVYFWLPKWTGHMYDERLGKIHFWVSVISVNVLFFPQHFLGLAGMPRRIADYPLQFTDWNMISSLGGFAFGLAQLLFAYIVIKTILGGVPAGSRPWEGADSLMPWCRSTTSFAWRRD